MLHEERRSVALAAASIFCMGGVIFGIASLYPVMYYERAFELSACGLVREHAARSPVKGCDEQQVQLTFVSSVALFAADGAMLVYGEIGDRIGPRACFGIGAVLAWLGLGLLALAAATNLDSLWWLAMLALGSSGPGVFMGCLYLGEVHPRVRAAISGVGASMWDASALVFLLFGTAYFATIDGSSSPSRVGLPVIALSWMCVCVCVGVPTWWALPSQAQLLQQRATMPVALATDGERAGQSQCFGEALADAPAKRVSKAEVQDNTFLSCLARRDTALMLLFMVVYNLKSSFYITTFADQMSLLFPDPVAKGLATTFNIAFPLGGFATSMGAAMLLEILGEREDLYMTLVVLLAITVSVYNLLPFVGNQFASALLFGPTRTLQWACYFHFLALPRRYPPQFVGRLLGYSNLVVAFGGDAPVALLSSFVTRSDMLGSVLKRYVSVHLALLIALVCALALPYHLHGQYNMRQQRVRAAAQDRGRRQKKASPRAASHRTCARGAVELQQASIREASDSEGTSSDDDEGNGVGRCTGRASPQNHTGSPAKGQGSLANQSKGLRLACPPRRQQRGVASISMEMDD